MKFCISSERNFLVYRLCDNGWIYVNSIVIVINFPTLWTEWRKSSSNVWAFPQNLLSRRLNSWKRKFHSIELNDITTWFANNYLGLNYNKLSCLLNYILCILLYSSIHYKLLFRFVLGIYIIYCEFSTEKWPCEYQVHNIAEILLNFLVLSF